MSYVSNDFFNYGSNGSNPRTKVKCPSTAAPEETVVIPYSGWSSWKNVVSGQYNRGLCAQPCASFKGYHAEAPGLYRAKTVTVQPQPNRECEADLREFRRVLYMDAVKSTTSRGTVPGYYNYLDYPGRREQGCPKTPVKYTRGWWPDETLQTFDKPRVVSTYYDVDDDTNTPNRIVIPLTY